MADAQPGPQRQGGAPGARARRRPAGDLRELLLRPAGRATGVRISSSASPAPSPNTTWEFDLDKANACSTRLAGRETATCGKKDGVPLEAHLLTTSTRSARRRRPSSRVTGRSWGSRSSCCRSTPASSSTAQPATTRTSIISTGTSASMPGARPDLSTLLHAALGQSRRREHPAEGERLGGGRRIPLQQPRVRRALRPGRQGDRSARRPPSCSSR